MAYFPIYGEEKEPFGVGAVVRDVTERTEIEQERDSLLRDVLIARAHAEAALVRARAERDRAEEALRDAEEHRAVADAARRRASFLATVTHRMAASMDFREAVREVVASAVPYIADWCIVSLIEPTGIEVLGFVHRDPERERLAEELAALYHPNGHSIVTKVLTTGQRDLRTDITGEQLRAIVTDVRQLDLLERLGIRHIGTWPIPGPRGGVLGALSLVLEEPGRRFSEDDLQLASVLATRAGLHITNSRLYAERSETARTLQASLLPHELPDVPGVELASAFEAAGDNNIVGGDFFDVFSTGDSGWGAILGDVSGKGARAAAITATARHTLRTAAVVNSHPAQNLALLNRMLLCDLSISEFCTAICARLRPEPNGLRVDLANGGHPPALVLRAAGEFEAVVAGRGPLIGIFEEPVFEETALKLGPGDLLLLHTDGVTDVRGQDAGRGERELIATAKAHCGAPARQVVEAVTENALRLHGNSVGDDIAVLAIRVPD